jgi:hypothetical protein
MRTPRIVAANAGIALFMCFTALSATPAFADCCSLNGSGCIYIPLTYGTAPWTTFCSTISGINCVATVPGSPTINVSSGDCITLGAGVTLDLGKSTINCTSTDCTAAVRNTDSGSSSSKVVVKNGTVTGCWRRGLHFESGVNSSVTGTVVNLAPTGAACTNSASLPTGIFAPRGTTNKVKVFNAFGGVYAFTGKDINDSLISECYIGIDNVGSTPSVGLTNLLLRNNVNHVKNPSYLAYKPKMQGSVLEGSVLCDCVDNGENCVNITSCIDFGNGGTGNTSFVEETLYP